MRKGSYVAALAVAGLLVVGCKDDSDTTAPPATPSNDEVQRQVDDATRVLREETSDLGQNIKEQASAAGAKLNQQVEQATQGLDAETREQFQKLQAAIQEKNWDDARSILQQLNAKRDQLTEQGRQLLDKLQAQVQASE